MNLASASLDRSNALFLSQPVPVVFVVDGDAVARQSLAAAIQDAGRQPVAFASVREFHLRARDGVPSCLILDVSRAEDLDALALGRLDMPTIVVTERGDVPMAVRAMKAGAADFLTKPITGDALMAVVEQALERSRTALHEEERMRALRARHAALTAREREVLVLVVTGLLNKQIGGRLGISEITVKAHRGGVMRKMNAKSLADLVRMASRLGLNAAGNC